MTCRVFKVHLVNCTASSPALVSAGEICVFVITEIFVRAISLPKVGISHLAGGAESQLTRMVDRQSDYRQCGHPGQDFKLRKIFPE